MRIPFAEWLPDLETLNNPGSIEAKNVIPAVDGYKKLPSHSAVSSAVDSVCIGPISAIANDGTIYNYAGTTNSIYELRTGSWVGRLNHYFVSTVGTIKLSGIVADVVFS